MHLRIIREFHLSHSYAATDPGLEVGGAKYCWWNDSANTHDGLMTWARARRGRVMGHDSTHDARLG
jgi:hypothetical protein